MIRDDELPANGLSHAAADPVATGCGELIQERERCLQAEARATNAEWQVTLLRSELAGACHARRRSWYMHHLLH